MKGLVAIAILVAALAASGSGTAAEPAGEFRVVLPTLSRDAAAGRMLSGLWGGVGMNMERDATGVTRLEFDCANGLILGPLSVDGDGSFAWEGLYVREHGGPIREGELPEVHEAVYSGRVAGPKMQLTVRLSETGDDIGPFNLAEGGRGRVFKCL